jgi:hypothetical protein
LPVIFPHQEGVPVLDYSGNAVKDPAGDIDDYEKKHTIGDKNDRIGLLLRKLYLIENAADDQWLQQPDAITYQ